MYCSKIRFIDIVIVTILFSCATIRAAVPGPEPRETKYIVYSYGARDYFPIVEKVAAALQLPSPSERASIFYVEHKKDFNEKIRHSRNVNWVCVAHYDKCRPVAELTRSLHEDHRIDVDFHSILFFDSDPVERGAGAFTEIIANTFSSIPLDIRFEKILHRVYNFYSEESSAWYRKIYPADKVITTDLLPIADWIQAHPPYLKGVNIKCFDIGTDNTLNNVNFSKKTGWPLSTTFAPSDDLVKAAEKIGQTIRYIDDNYLINTDLTAVLINQSPTTENNVIPNKTAKDPMVIINRPTVFDGENLSQIIASEGWIVNATKWTLMINSITQRNKIFSQIAAEAGNNAIKNAITPYFYPWMEYYRSLNIKSRIPGYQWFDQLAIVATDPHKKEIAYATRLLPETCNYLCNSERDYLTARKPIMAETLRTQQFPKIAVVASGGGIRAMLTTLGFLRGLERIGLSETRTLLDCITYACGLSGSTWAIGPWISSGQTVEEYIRVSNIVEKVENFKGAAEALQTIFKNLFSTGENKVKAVFGQPWTFVDSWGLYISNNLLISPEMQLSNQMARITDGRKPLPIYTAVDENARNRDWFEFTPFEVGSLRRHVYIPSWSFGRQFIAGISQDFPPEQSLGYLLGIFGSAMGARLKDVIGSKITGVEWNITAGTIPNFYFGMKGIEGNTATNINLVDAGAHFNLPYPPISGINPARKADIIIFVDASGESGEEIGGEIRKMIAWQQEQSKIYPDIKLPTEMNDWCNKVPRITRDLRIRTFAGNARKGIPTVIYLPIALDVHNDRQFPFDRKQEELIAIFQHDHQPLLMNYTNANLMEKYPTTTFNYLKDQSNFLLDLMTLNAQISASQMMNEIKQYIDTMPQ